MDAEKMSAIDSLLAQLDQPDHTHVWSRDDVLNARAELSALRASPPGVAREFLRVADDLRSTANLILYRCKLHEDYQSDLRRDIAAYDALRPAATGEGDADAMLDEIEGVLNEFFGANRDDDRDTRPLREQLRAAIARAEGRKGT